MQSAAVVALALLESASAFQAPALKASTKVVGATMFSEGEDARAGRATLFRAVLFLSSLRVVYFIDVRRCACTAVEPSAFSGRTLGVRACRSLISALTSVALLRRCVDALASGEPSQPDLVANPSLPLPSRDTVGYCPP